MRSLILAASLCVLATPALAQSQSTATAQGSPLIDYAGFTKLTGEVEQYRENRLINLKDFKQRAKRRNILILDARAETAFKEGHIKGAVNLPLPDFNGASLAKVIGDNPDREILIYCNNNFINNVRPVPTKVMRLALNIQTFINLYGYGYRNVYELGEAVDMRAPEVEWVGTVPTNIFVGPLKPRTGG